MLWGRNAQDAWRISQSLAGLVLKASHPSPFSVAGFSGCKHFSQANNFLCSSGQQPIDWGLQ